MPATPTRTPLCNSSNASSSSSPPSTPSTIPPSTHPPSLSLVDALALSYQQMGHMRAGLLVGQSLGFGAEEQQQELLPLETAAPTSSDNRLVTLHAIIRDVLAVVENDPNLSGCLRGGRAGSSSPDLEDRRNDDEPTSQ